MGEGIKDLREIGNRHVEHDLKPGGTRPGWAAMESKERGRIKRKYSYALLKTSPETKGLASVLSQQEENKEQ